MAELGIKDAEQMLTDCESRESRMSDWEAGFIDSLQYALAHGRSLTQRQETKLTDIWERVTADG